MACSKTILQWYVVLVVNANVSWTKIYQRCELAQELVDRFSFPINTIADWMCTLFWESGFNTQSYKNSNFDGSRNYGLFQINDLLWCKAKNRQNTNFCNSSCKKFQDEDISDDVECALLIYKMQGLSAWENYNIKCQGDTSNYIEGCRFNSSGNLSNQVINIDTSQYKQKRNDKTLKMIKKIIDIDKNLIFPQVVVKQEKLSSKKMKSRKKRALMGHDTVNPFEDARVFVFNPLCCFGWKAADVEWSNMKNLRNTLG